MGASGSGTTTLGRALADFWSVPHADADDYFWLPTDPPYVTARPEQARLDLMREMFVPREAWVLSGSITRWGESVIAECDAVVFLTLDPIERMRRLRARETERRSGAMVEDAAWKTFEEWARRYDDPAFEGRSRRGHDAWLSQLPLPMLRLDGARPVDELRDAIVEW